MKLLNKSTWLQLLWLGWLRTGPRWLAHWIATYAAKMGHNEGGRWCWPCEARARIKHDSHERTHAPNATIYCNKCGLPATQWRPWCSNKVEKVNSVKPKPSKYAQVGW